MSFPKIAIIVLNWNGWHDTIECLGSLAKIDYPNYQIIVVDNGSTDNSVPRIKQWASDSLPGMKLIELKENLGYAKGNNEGIRYAAKDKGIEFILILNNDTVVKEDFLNKLMEGFDAGDNVALVGPKILNYEKTDYLRSEVYKRPGFFAMLIFFSPLKNLFSRLPLLYLKQPKNDDPRKVYAISGSCMLFRKTAMQDIGGFDEATFLGWEEFIIAEKMKRKGYSTLLAPKSIIYHKWGRSTAKIDPADKMISFLKSEKYFQRNYLHLPSFQYGILNTINLFIFVLYSIVNADYRKNLIKIIYAMFGQ